MQQVLEIEICENEEPPQTDQALPTINPKDNKPCLKTEDYELLLSKLLATSFYITKFPEKDNDHLGDTWQSL